MTNGDITLKQAISKVKSEVEKEDLRLVSAYDGSGLVKFAWNNKQTNEDFVKDLKEKLEYLDHEKIFRGRIGWGDDDIEIEISCKKEITKVFLEQLDKFLNEVYTWANCEEDDEYGIDYNGWRPMAQSHKGMIRVHKSQPGSKTIKLLLEWDNSGAY